MNIKTILEIRTPKPNLPIIPAMAKRFSPRVFNSEPIPQKDIEIIMEAARFSPSARFNQPWSYFITKKGTVSFDKLLTCIPDRNQWCSKAPILIITTYNPQEPIEGINKWAQYDLGAANYGIVLQAQELGYYTRQIGSLDNDKIKEVFSDVIKDPLIPFIVLAIGKVGNDEDFSNADKVYTDKDMIPPGRRESIFEILE